MNIGPFVILRNGERAELIGPIELRDYRIAGRHERGTYEIWTHDGFWHSEKTPHPLDIVTAVSAETGALVAFPNTHFSKSLT